MKKITVVIVGNTNQKAMRFAIDTTLENTPDVETVLQVGNLPLGYGHHIPLRENFTVDDYSYFMIKNLWACFVTNIIGSDALGIICGSEIGVALV